MAENPTSSSTTYTTRGAPSGALGGSNGVQSGTESLMSTLIVPLNGSLTLQFLPSSLTAHVSSQGTAARAVADRRCSLAEQLGLGRGELVVGQGALIMQGGEL